MSKYPNWTKEEEDLLAEKYTLVSDKALASELGRTVSGMRAHASKLHLVRYGNFLNASNVAQIFTVDVNTVTKIWIKRNYLKAKKSHVGSGRNQNWKIEEKDVEKFIKNYQDLYNPGRVNPELFPYWANLVKKYVPKDYVSGYGGLYTPEEDAFIFNNRSKLNQEQIAKQLHRTKESIHQRVMHLRKNGFLMPYIKNWKTRKKEGLTVRRWTPQEDQYLRENWGRPLTQEEIKSRRRIGTHFTGKDASIHLGRTISSCWTRASRLGLINENWNKDGRKTA